LEAGSGSGFLSLFLSKCVGQSGEVWSFEIREDFHKEAKKNADYWNPNHKIKYSSLPFSNYCHILISILSNE
jgi:tRNA A58 N-methylase Trm61